MLARITKSIIVFGFLTSVFPISTTNNMLLDINNQAFYIRQGWGYLGIENKRRSTEKLCLYGG